MPSTSKGFRYPASSAAPNVPQDLQNLAADVNSKATVLLGNGHMASPNDLLIAAFPSYTDVATLTATSFGGQVTVEFYGSAYNGSSGADRTLDWRVVVDGASIGSVVGITIPLANLRPVPRAGFFASTPTAGSHTWKLQATASVATAVYVQTGLINVWEK